MHLYKDGMVCYADKDQVEYFLADGWSKEKPSEEEVVVESTPEVEESEAGEEEVVDLDQVADTDEVVGDEVDSSSNQPTGRKIIRKGSKKA